MMNCTCLKQFFYNRYVPVYIHFKIQKYKSHLRLLLSGILLSFEVCRNSWLREGVWWRFPGLCWVTKWYLSGIGTCVYTVDGEYNRHTSLHLLHLIYINGWTDKALSPGSAYYNPIGKHWQLATLLNYCNYYPHNFRWFVLSFLPQICRVSPLFSSQFQHHYRVNIDRKIWCSAVNIEDQ